MLSRRKTTTNDSATCLGFETEIGMEHGSTLGKIRHSDLRAKLKGLGYAL